MRDDGRHAIVYGVNERPWSDSGEVAQGMMMSFNVIMMITSFSQALGKTSTKPSKSLDKNVHWNEITTYTRLALGSGTSTNHAIQNTLLVPEVVHLVTLLAGQGELCVRNTVYGLTLQLFQSLYAMHADDSTHASDIRGLLHELSLPSTVRLFGLSQVAKTSEYTAFDCSDDRNCLKELSRWLLSAIDTCSGNIGQSVQNFCRSCTDQFWKAWQMSGDHVGWVS